MKTFLHTRNYKCLPTSKQILSIACQYPNKLPERCDVNLLIFRARYFEEWEYFLGKVGSGCYKVPVFFVIVNFRDVEDPVFSFRSLLPITEQGELSEKMFREFPGFNPASQLTNDGDNTALLVALIIALLGFFAATGAAIFLYLRRKPFPKNLPQPEKTTQVPETKVVPEKSQNGFMPPEYLQRSETQQKREFGARVAEKRSNEIVSSC